MCSEGVSTIAKRGEELTYKDIMNEFEDYCDSQIKENCINCKYQCEGGKTSFYD